MRRTVLVSGTSASVHTLLRCFREAGMHAPLVGSSDPGATDALSKLLAAPDLPQENGATEVVIEDLVAEMFYANLRQDFWGWSDPNAFRWARFFSEFEPHVHVYVIHDDVGTYLYSRAKIAVDLTENAVKTWIAEWIDLTRTVLIAVGSTGSRVHLVETDSVHVQTNEVMRLSGLEMSGQSAGVVSLNTESERRSPEDGMAAWAWSQWARETCPELASARSIFLGRLDVAHSSPSRPSVKELSTVGRRFALLPSGPEQTQRTGEVDSLSALGLKDMNRRIRALQGRAGLLERQLDESKRREVVLEASVASQKARLESAQTELSAVFRDRDIWRARTRFLQGRLEIILLGVDESRTARYECSSQILFDFWREQQPEDLWIDLRRPFVGKNWHVPENDGCWTGSCSTAEIILPVLRSGTYRIELELLGAMFDVFHSPPTLKIENRQADAELVPLVSDSGFPLLLVTTLAITETTADAVTLAIGNLMPSSPVDIGLPDNRVLGIRVRTVRFCRIADEVAYG